MAEDHDYPRSPSMNNLIASYSAPESNTQRAAPRKSRRQKGRLKGIIPVSLQRQAPEAILTDMADMTREEIDAKIAAADARTDAKFERVLSEMRVGFAKTASTSTVVATAITLFLGIAALVIGVLTYGTGTFYNGMSAQGVAAEAAKQAVVAYSAAHPAK